MILRGKDFSDSDIKLVKKTISENPSSSRRKLSILIAERLNWRQPNGHLKDRAVRDVLLRLDQKDIICLPEPVYELKKQTAGVKPIPFIEPTAEIVGQINDFGAPVFKVVETSQERQLWNYLIDKYPIITKLGWISLFSCRHCGKSSSYLFFKVRLSKDALGFS